MGISFQFLRYGIFDYWNISGGIYIFANSDLQLYNAYADQANYYDICLLIYQVAQHRNVADIRATWQNLLETTHNEALAKGDVQPYEVIGEQVRELGMRLNLSESIFPIRRLRLFALPFDRNNDL